MLKCAALNSVTRLFPFLSVSLHYLLHASSFYRLCSLGFGLWPSRIEFVLQARRLPPTFQKYACRIHWVWAWRVCLFTCALHLSCLGLHIVKPPRMDCLELPFTGTKIFDTFSPWSSWNRSWVARSRQPPSQQSRRRLSLMNRHKFGCTVWNVSFRERSVADPAVIYEGYFSNSAQRRDSVLSKSICPLLNFFLSPSILMFKTKM